MSGACGACRRLYHRLWEALFKKHSRPLLLRHVVSVFHARTNGVSDDKYDDDDDYDYDDDDDDDNDDNGRSSWLAGWS